MTRQPESTTTRPRQSPVPLTLQQARDRITENIPPAWLPGLVLLCSVDPHTHGRLDKETGKRVMSPCSTPGKRPLEMGWNRLAAHRWKEAASGRTANNANLAALAGHLMQGGNLGMCPPPGIVILDADSVDAVEMLDNACAPGTPVMSRADDSAHFYLRYDAADLPLKAKQTKWGDESHHIIVDLRTPARAVKDSEKAGGAQTACPPSRHKSGTHYAWRVPLPESLDDVPPMPVELVEIFRTFHKVEVGPAKVTGEMPGHDRLRGYVNRWCRYLTDKEAIREKAIEYAKEVYADRKGRLEECVQEGGELDRLIESGWILFGGLNPLGEDRTDEAFVDLFIATRDDWRYNTTDNRWHSWNHFSWVGIPVEFVRFAIGEMHQIIFEDAAREVADGERRGRLTKMSKALRTSAKVTQVLKRLQDRVAVENKDLDSNPDLMTFPSEQGYPAVTVNLETGEVYAPRREDLITRVTGGPYVVGPWREICPEVGAFMDQTFPKTDLLHFVLRCMGFTTLGRTLEHVFLFMYGHADSGKSTFLNGFANSLGDYATSTPFDVFTGRGTGSGPNTYVASWKGCRMVVCSEIPKNTKLGAAMKDYTGGDQIAAHHKFGHAFRFTPQHTVWVAGNDRPQADHMDSGIERRLKCIPADEVVPKKKIDKKLPKKFEAPMARAAFMAMAMEGLRMYQAAGIGSCEEVEQASDDYWREMNPVSGWFEDCCERGPGKLGLNEIRENYEAWLGEHYGYAEAGKRRLGKMHFRVAIERLGHEIIKDRLRKIWVNGIRFLDDGRGLNQKAALENPAKLPDMDENPDTPN